MNDRANIEASLEARNTDRLSAISSYFACGLVASLALSVSASHIFATLLLIVWLIRLILDKASSFPAIFSHIHYRVAFSYFAWLLIAAIIAIFSERVVDIAAYSRELFKSEVSDVYLLIVTIPLYQSAKEYPKRIEKALIAFALLTLISGFMAFFSEVRLNKLFTGKALDGFSASNRPQFPFIQIFSVQLYRPIGFMNTRLSYATLLLFSFWIFIYQLIKKTDLKTRILNLLFLLGILLILYANAARSVQLALIISFLLFTASFFIHKLKYRRIYFVFIVMILIITALFLSIDQPATRHTDYMRPVIWHEAISVFQQYWLTGTGPGLYTIETLLYRENVLYEHLWYFYQIVPSSHAHNDFLHAAVIGGIVGLVLFALLAFTIFRAIFNSSQVDIALRALYSANGAFFIAALFQCYFLDDESVLVFWTVLAIASAQTAPISRQRDSQKKSV